MAGIKMNVEFPTRLCEVNGKLGYFHRWEQWSKVVDASPLRGGHPGGQNGQVFGIVEFEDAFVVLVRLLSNSVMRRTRYFVRWQSTMRH